MHALQLAVLQFLELPLDSGSADSIMNCGSVQLRVIFFDTRNGLERQFTSKRDNPALFRSGGLATDDEGAENEDDIDNASGSEVCRQRLATQTR